jgi:hypothetical protein
MNDISFNHKTENVYESVLLDGVAVIEKSSPTINKKIIKLCQDVFGRKDGGSWSDLCEKIYAKKETSTEKAVIAFAAGFYLAQEDGHLKEQILKLIYSTNKPTMSMLLEEGLKKMDEGKAFIPFKYRWVFLFLMFGSACYAVSIPVKEAAEVIMKDPKIAALSVVRDMKRAIDKLN